MISLEENQSRRIFYSKNDVRAIIERHLTTQHQLKNKILLARPNAIIIKHMQALITDAKCTSIKLNNLDELAQIDQSTVKAIVISTAVVSTINETYLEAMKRVCAEFRETPPLILATLTDTSNIIKVVKQSFGETLHLNTLDDHEMSKKNMAIVIHKSDLMDKTRRARILDLLSTF